MGFETILTTLAVAAAVAGTVVSVKGQEAAADAQAQSQKLQGRLNDIRAQRDKTQQIREARMKRAIIEQNAANSGAGDSSSALGGAGEVTSNLASNIAYINTQQDYGKAISKQGVLGARAQGQEALGEGIAKIGATVFANRQEIGDEYNSVFKSDSAFDPEADASKVFSA